MQLSVRSGYVVVHIETGQTSLFIFFSEVLVYVIVCPVVCTHIGPVIRTWTRTYIGTDAGMDFALMTVRMIVRLFVWSSVRSYGVHAIMSTISVLEDCQKYLLIR